MLKPEMIPKEVVEAAARALHANVKLFHDILWDDLGKYGQDAYREEAAAVLFAGLNAWPNGYLHSSVLRDLAAIILPLPEAPQGRIAKQEAGDETVP